MPAEPLPAAAGAAPRPPSTRPRRAGLRLRIVGAISALVAVVLFANAAILAWTSRRTLRHDLESRADSFAALAVGPLCSAWATYYTSGYGKFRELATDLVRLNPDLARMAVFDTGGHVLFDSSEFANPVFDPESRRHEPAADPREREAAGSMATVRWQARDAAGRPLHFVVVPHIEEWGRHRYSALFGFSYGSLEAAMRAGLVRLLWLSVASLALGVLIAVLLARQSLEPIELLSQGARDLAEGRLDRRIELRSGDEFEVLAATFNLMATRLATTISDLGASNVALEGINRELKELDRMKSDLLANVSHELRTPLTAIQGYTEAVEDGMLGPVSDPQREAFEVVRRNILRLRSMIDQLLSYSRLEAGRVRIDPQPFDLAALAEQVIVAVRPAVPAGIALELAVAPDLPQVVGDPARVAQVLENLLTNALKFTPAGGSVALQIAPVAAAADGAAGEVEIAVRDTGIGIPAEALPRIFDRFYQVDSSSTRRYGGMGLGLAIVQEIVAAHRGRVEVESAPGKGSTFRFRLPAAAAAAPAGAAAGPRVLLVDDDAVFAGTVGAALAGHGYRVETAPSLAVAVDAVRAAPPDLVLLDRLLPDGDGFDLLDGLRDGDGLRVPVVVVSVRKERALGLRLGAAGYLVKPVDPEALHRAIAEVLGEPAAASPGAAPPLVLVVDDEEDLRELLGDRLRAQGYRVRVAAGGNEALACVAAEPPGLVLLDLMMPDLDGWEVLRRLRADERTRALPVIVLTARDTPQDRRIGAELSILDFLDKPFDMGRLLAEIDRSLGRRSAGSAVPPAAGAEPAA